MFGRSAVAKLCSLDQGARQIYTYLVIWSDTVFKDLSHIRPVLDVLWHLR